MSLYIFVLRLNNLFLKRAVSNAICGMEKIPFCLRHKSECLYGRGGKDANVNYYF